MPDWYIELLGRCEGLPEPLRAYGVGQCEEAWATYQASKDWRIPHQLREEVESLEFGLSEIRTMSPGRQQVELERAGLYLSV